jgi:hypothetical protein
LAGSPPLVGNGRQWIGTGRRELPQADLNFPRRELGKVERRSLHRREVDADISVPTFTPKKFTPRKFTPKEFTEDGDDGTDRL